MNNTKSASTPIIFRVTPPAGTTLKVKDLKQMAVDEKDVIKLCIAKALQNDDGSISTIAGISNQQVEIEVILNGMASRSNLGSVGYFMGWTCGAVALPGLPTKLTVYGVDADGKPVETKENDTVGFNEPTVYVEFVFDDGAQTGELRCYVNNNYTVQPGTMTGAFPIDHYGDIRTPIPTACHADVDEASINA